MPTAGPTGRWVLTSPLPKSNAKTYGERNSTEGAIFVRIKPTKIMAA
jgi:hypothetical protein